MLILSVISVFLLVSVLVGTALYLYLTKRSVTEERIEKLMAITRTPSQMDFKSTLIRKDTPLQALLTRIGNLIPSSKNDHKTYSSTLVAAGFRKETVPIFVGIKVLLAISLPVFYLVFYALPKGTLLNSESLLFVMITAILGFLLPTFWLRKVVKTRNTLIFHTLPDVLDLMTVCVEAGISIDAAMVKACENPQFRGNPLTGELRKVNLETRAGKLRSEAMRDMAARAQVEDLSAFVTMLIQTERFGSSLGQALRIHSESLRTKRRQIAEEEAAKTAIKMLFPLVIFVFPSLLVIILGPALIMLQGFSK